MRIQFHVIDLPLPRISRVEAGYIQLTNYRPVKLYRKKIRSLHPLEYIGTVHGELYSTLIQPWYEFHIVSQEGVSCDFFCYMQLEEGFGSLEEMTEEYPLGLLYQEPVYNEFLYSNAYIDPRYLTIADYTFRGGFSSSGSQMASSLPETLYKKTDKTSNIYNFMTSLGEVIDELRTDMLSILTTRNFGSTDPFQVDVSHEYYYENLNNPVTALKPLYQSKNTEPTSYTLAGSTHHLALGYHDVKGNIVVTKRYYTDETKHMHQITFVLKNGNLYLCSRYTGDCFGTINLYDRAGNLLVQPIGADLVGNVLYVLCRNGYLHYFNVQNRFDGYWLALGSIPVEIRGRPHGLKMGNSFFVTRTTSYQVYMSEYNQYDELEGGIRTYGNTSSIKNYGSETTAFFSPTRTLNHTTDFDRSVEALGFHRALGVRLAYFLLVISSVNCPANASSIDPIHQLLRQNGIVCERFPIAQLQKRDLTEKDTCNLTELLSLTYSDTVNDLKWGALL